MTMITTAIVTVMTGTVMTGTVMTGTVMTGTVTKRTIRSPGANGINNSARKPKKYTGKKDS